MLTFKRAPAVRKVVRRQTERVEGFLLLFFFLNTLNAQHETITMNQLKREIPKAKWMLQINRRGCAHPYVQHVGCGHADVYRAVIFARAQPVISTRFALRRTVIFCLLCPRSLQPAPVS